MKIINIMQGTDLGGMEQASLRLMIGLKDLGHSLEVLSLNPIGDLGILLKNNGIPAKGLPYQGKGGWRSYFLLKQTINKIQADALIMTGHHLLSMIALGNLWCGRRILAQHFHHTGVKPLWQWRLIYRVACNRFQAITFPSDFVRQEAERIYPPIKSLSRTVLNPVPNRMLPNAEDRTYARLSLGLSLDSPIIGNAGWLIPRKRFDVFIRTAQQILCHLPNALFLIAGDGEDRGMLQELARDLKISEQVKWLGWQRDLSQFYLSIDVMLFNSDWDAMGLVPLEALSYAVPVVASVQHGGLKEILNKNNYGFLIPKHNIQTLAEKVVYYIRNPNEARKIALKGRERVIQVSNTQKIAGEIVSLLSKGCGE